MFISLRFLLAVPIIKTEPTDEFEPALTCGPASQGLSPLVKPRYSQQLAVPPAPGSCLVAGFPPCPQRSTVMSPLPCASPELHDLSSAAYSKDLASPGCGHLGLQRPTGGILTAQEAPRPVGVHPGSPQQPPPALLQPQVSPQPSSSVGRRPALSPDSPPPTPPGAQELTCLQSCSPARPSVLGRPQQQVPEVSRSESAAARPLPLPEVREDSTHSLAPMPVMVKREPQDLDQLYLDDGKCPHLVCAHLARVHECVEEGVPCCAHPCGRPFLLLRVGGIRHQPAAGRIASSHPFSRMPTAADLGEHCGQFPLNLGMPPFAGQQQLVPW